MNLAQRIQTLRRQKGLSQEALAYEIGVSRQAVSKWESEQAYPDLEKIILLSDYFEVSTDFLLKGIESRSIPSNDSAKILSILPVAINASGLILTILLWSHYQTNLCYIPVFFCNIGSMIVYSIESSITQDKKLTRKKFWQKNIWLMALIPSLMITNMSLFFVHHPVAWIVSLIPYVLICLSVCFFIK